MYGTGPSAENCYENTKVGDQNLYGPGSSTENNMGSKNVTKEFGEYRLEELGKEFMSSATESEKEYVLPKTVGGSRVHLLLGVKSTRVQPVLLLIFGSRSVSEPI